MTKQNVRLTAINIALMLALAASLITVGLRNVGAQEEPTPEGNTAETTSQDEGEDGHDCDFDGFEDFAEYDDGFDELIKVLGITEEKLWEELDAGKSYAEIAQANGVDVQKVIDALVAVEVKFIDELVADSEITAEEAAEWKADTVKWVTYDVNNVYVDPYDVAATTLGIDEEAFWTELDSGKTIAEVAQANGVDVQKVIDALVASENTQIDKQVAAGVLTEEDAKAWREEISQYVNDIVNSNFDDYFDIEFDEDSDLDIEGEGQENSDENEESNG